MIQKRSTDGQYEHMEVLITNVTIITKGEGAGVRGPNIDEC